VPGAVSAWVALSSRFGKLDFAQLFEPAIEYALNGYAVTPIIANSWQRAAAILSSEPGFAGVFMPGGNAPNAGEVFRSPEMAATLELIAKTRGEAFYRGELAEKLVAFSNLCGGVMAMEDLETHEANWCGTISSGFNGYEIHEIPPNGQGISALMALGILEHFENLGDLDPDSVESIHLQVEAMKLAFADLHEHVADPSYMTLSPRDLLCPAYLKERAGLIDLTRSGDFSFGVPSKAGTVYLTSADSEGRMELYGIRFGRRGPWNWNQPPKPGLWIPLEAWARQLRRSQKATLSHDHPVFRHARRAT
jgi:gamma-glutamyltranspeptidase / glutathione hydrolase